MSDSTEQLLDSIREIERSEKRLYAFALEVLHDRNCLCHGCGRCVLCTWRRKAAEATGREYVQVGERGPDDT